MHNPNPSSVLKHHSSPAHHLPVLARNLQRLLGPASIAVFGGRFAEKVIRQNEAIGFAGDIWPVHPYRDTVGGIRCWRTVEELPHAPDASFIATPAAITVDLVRHLARRGAGGVVCYASGFAERGAGGARLQQQLVEAAGDLALVGPNCYGVLNYLDRALLWPDEHGGEPVDSGVAIISQSGNVSITMSMQQRSLPIACQVATGNQAVLNLAHYLRVFADDPRIRAIGLHFEGVNDVAALQEAARYALARRVPVVALKSGSSAVGTEAALSHTRSLTGSERGYEALFRRCGIARVHTVPQFLETLKLLYVHGALPQATIASISCSGGEAALVADLAATLGLTFPPLAGAQVQQLRTVLGPNVALANPLDYHTDIWGDTEAQQKCFTAVANGAQALTLKVLDYPRTDRCDVQAWHDTCEAFIAAVHDVSARGIVVSTLPEGLPLDTRRQLLASGVAPMQGLEECLIAVRAVVDISQAQRVANANQQGFPYTKKPPGRPLSNLKLAGDRPPYQGVSLRLREQINHLIRGSIRLALAKCGLGGYSVYGSSFLKATLSRLLPQGFLARVFSGMHTLPPAETPRLTLASARASHPPYQGGDLAAARRTVASKTDPLTRGSHAQTLVDASRGLSKTDPLIRGSHALNLNLQKGRAGGLSVYASSSAQEEAIAAPGTLLDEAEAREYLATSGVRFAPWRVCGAKDACQAAATLGFPVAIKALVPGLAHKTEAGAVRLHLQSPAEVAEAVGELSALGERFLVEAMVTNAVAELLVGINHEPLFGPVITVGSGGVWAELFADALCLLLPLQEEEVHEALSALRVARLFAGYRGQVAANVANIVQPIMSLGTFAAQHADEIIELDINPLLILPGEEGVVAVDALVHVQNRREK